MYICVYFCLSDYHLERRPEFGQQGASPTLPPGLAGLGTEIFRVYLVRAVQFRGDVCGFWLTSSPQKVIRQECRQLRRTLAIPGLFELSTLWSGPCETFSSSSWQAPRRCDAGRSNYAGFGKALSGCILEMGGSQNLWVLAFLVVQGPLQAFNAQKSA